MKTITKNLAVVLLLFAGASNGLFSQTFRVDTILFQGDVSYPINLVFLGDGFLESELQDFRDVAELYTNLLFTVDPFSTHKPFFNSFAISVPSNESGAAPDPDNLIDNYFGSTFGYAGIDRLLVPTNNSRISTVLANNFPEYDQVFMLVNSDKYGGSGGWVATASMHEDSPDIALHELGHSFANLADEYWAGSQYAREAINMTQETDLELLKWRNWYGDSGIGLYAHAESPSWYRPHQSCIMRYLGEPFCAVCREGVVEQIYDLASPFKGYEPENTTFQITSDSIRFKLDLNHPQPTSLERKWYLNESLVGVALDSITIRSADLIEGSNTVVASVTDTSYRIRPYEGETFHRIEVTWNVTKESLGSEQITILNHSAINLYPNPVQDHLTVQILGEQSGEVYIELYDSRGMLVQNNLEISSGTRVLDISSLEAGIFLIRFYRDGRFIASRRIIKE